MKHSSPLRWLPVMLLVALFVATTRAPARAESPYDARQRALAQRALAHGRDASAAIEVFELLRQRDRVAPEVARALYQKLAHGPGMDVQHRATMLRASALELRREGKLTESAAAFDALGYLRKFRVVGPFDNEGKRGFEHELGPERERTDAPKTEAEYEGRERPVRWRALPDIAPAGYVDLEALFRPSENVCGFAETAITLSNTMPLTLWLGGGGASKLYFNGEEVVHDPSYRGVGYDRHVASVEGRKGVNRVLVKVCTAAASFGFSLRVGDAKGEPLVVEHGPESLAAVPVAASLKAKRAGGPVSVLAQLEKAAMGERASPAALEQLARFLWYSNADDPAEHRSRQLAIRAAEQGPTAGRFLLASSLAEERWEKMRLMRRAVALAPKDPDVLIANARLVSAGPGGERALATLDGAPSTGAAGIDVLEARTGLLRQLDLDHTARATAHDALARAPKAEALLELTSEVSSLDARKDEPLRLARELVSLRYDHYPARRMLIESAIAEGREAEALEHLDALRALFPASEKRTLFLADAYDALDREDLELALLKHALDVAPESAALHVRVGRALLRGGHTEAAAESLRHALRLAPQDAATRELLEQIVPEQRRDEGYAIGKDQLLARRAESSAKSGHPLTVLHDLQVTTVFENGLGSRFVQFAAQAHDAEGARRLRARSIQFDPESQRVDIRLARVYRADGKVLEATETYEEQLGEPWYRMYYDTRALVVVFPDLEPGDSVELRYRIDDVAPRNLFADYFGDMHLLASGEPKVQVEYVLITPTTRKFYFNQPRIALEKQEEVQGNLRIQRFRANDVPALRSEPNMPGIGETVPYLHVSTYASWQDVGRWWWGLVHDQLYADESLKRVVAQLKKGAKDERQVVERIYGWVVKNTRYVALEFGIHGFLPYRVPEIVRRGFGDCKDKAALIYTMLREAGVDARLVLVRTDRNGAIDPEPASLSVFDHAIAYVPKLDLYLDGTAEHSGTRELPAGDQGVMVLQVGPDGAELKTTPVLPAERNVRARTVSVQLEEDGSGTLSSEERISGADAAGYRSTFQAAGTRRDRLQRQLSGSFPGLSLQSHAFTGLDDIERDVTVDYKLKAPLIARTEGDALRVSTSALGNLVRDLAPSPTRTYDLDLDLPRIYREQRTVKAPAGYAVRDLPKGGKVESRFGSLTLTTEQRGGAAVSAVELVLSVKRVKKSDYAEFRRFVEQAEGLLRSRTAFARTSAPATPAAPSAKETR